VNLSLLFFVLLADAEVVLSHHLVLSSLQRPIVKSHLFAVVRLLLSQVLLFRHHFDLSEVARDPDGGALRAVKVGLEPDAVLAVAHFLDDFELGAFKVRSEVLLDELGPFFLSIWNLAVDLLELHLIARKTLVALVGGVRSVGDEDLILVRSFVLHLAWKKLSVAGFVGLIRESRQVVCWVF